PPPLPCSPLAPYPTLFRSRPAAEVLETMDAAAVDDARWRDGRTMSLVFDPGEEVGAFVKQAYTRFFSENALNPSAFPSLRRFEKDRKSTRLNSSHVKNSYA